jgi:hypothetical protein
MAATSAESILQASVFRCRFWRKRPPAFCRSGARNDVLGGPGGELTQRVLGTGARLRGVDDELLVGVGVGGERIPVERDLTDDGMVLGPCAPPFHGNVCSGPPLAELLVSDREVADELGKARIVGLACRLHPDVGDD